MVAGQKLIVVKKASGQPGFCCDERACEPGLVCPPPLRLGAGGQCVCDPLQCPPPPVCPPHLQSIILHVDSECCPAYECAVVPNCPPDSYWDGECTCYPCQEPPCNNTSSPELVSQATHKPGSFCGVYKCKDTIDCPRVMSPNWPISIFEHLFI